MILTQKVNGKNEKGGQGVLPLGCLPLWGREGVTLIIPQTKYQAFKR
jgi:hypothetical protein